MQRKPLVGEKPLHGGENTRDERTAPLPLNKQSDADVQCLAWDSSEPEFRRESSPEYKDYLQALRNHKYKLPKPGMLEPRLRYALNTLWWSEDVGCELCYIERRQVSRTHNLSTCPNSTARVDAVEMVGLLDSLESTRMVCKPWQTCEICEILGISCPTTCDSASILKRFFAALYTTDAGYFAKIASVMLKEEGVDIQTEATFRAYVGGRLVSNQY